MESLTVFSLRVPRENEYTPENAEALLAAFSKLASPNFLLRLLGKQSQTIAFEIINLEQQIHFQVCLPEALVAYFESQIMAAYPAVVLERIKDPLEEAGMMNQASTRFGQLVLDNYFFYPLKTFRDFQEVDPLGSVLGLMSKAGAEDKLAVQLIVAKAPGNWRVKAQKFLDKGREIEEGKVKPQPDAMSVNQKLAAVGLRVGIRLAASSEEWLKNLADSFSVFSRADGNSLVLKKPLPWQKKAFREGFTQRRLKGTPKYQVLTTQEVASLWHLPNKEMNIANIAWGRGAFSEPPENLPVATGVSEEEKKEVAVFAETTFKNQTVKFGIKREDRRRHIYIIGKTGVGKSTLIANMAIDDIKKGRGVAVVDPHGDLTEIMLDFIPKNRINEVVYFNPADREYPMAINPLETLDKVQRELVASGIVAIFYKLYYYSWGPRLEYILRNTILSLTQIENATLVDVPRILTEEKFRQTVVDKLDDPVLKRFWTEEFNKMNERLRSEAISPILNKVGQFVSSPLIREIISQPRSKIDFSKMMNEGKILIANLSQGKLGEDNAALLGAMLITKLQLAAMSRVEMPEEKRPDFYLYVDEFQNFATQSFIKILSEARKYRLNIALANQYIGQLSEDVIKAIFGNAGTLVSFAVGARDADFLTREFGREYKEEDLVNLPNFKIIIRLAIDNLASRPFMAQTLPLPSCRNQNREKIIQGSRERYGRRK